MVRVVRRRYVAFKLTSPLFLSRKELLTLISDTISKAPGGECLDQQYIRIIHYDSSIGFGVVRCDWRTVVALRTQTKFSEEQGFKTIKTSGTIKALKKRLQPIQTTILRKQKGLV